MPVKGVAIRREPSSARSVSTVATSIQHGRVRKSGKFFLLGQEKWYVRGLTYGPFAPNSCDEFLPERPRLLSDFRAVRRLGANAIRLYHVPTRKLLDDALEQELRVLIDVPWEKHRCFFEDYRAQADAIARVRRAARELGDHPGTFAISVANEIPHDIVRFYSAARVERFINTLIDVVKQAAPDCLATYTNYPSTEFLNPPRLDFYCANLYLHDPEQLGRYLDRLQHVAGPLPLILGESGFDSIRHTEAGQAAALEKHVGQIFFHGLAGSFVFSYTDDWFTGGHQIEDWAFGITDSARRPKPAAKVLAKVWSRVPHVSAQERPRVSVVVCSYNGAATLEECLHSLVALDYPDYETILVDDGSTDHTPQIVKRFPQVRHIRQHNRGLSAARNIGAQAATGEIVAYLDSDCVADAQWLTYLVGAMQAQQVDAIGGPNLPPPSDNHIARCVAASPGGPSHVLLDDVRAEHVPGCNMAFRREKLLDLGGFDPQFRIAGDDVDICWRFTDAGMNIGYAASAIVWHHRRNTIGAYCRQQKGYGRAEAMLQFKYPQRFNALGCSQWRGIIYGEGAVGLPVSPPTVYHGKFGSGLFQIVYRRNEYSHWAYCTLLEWHAAAAGFLALALAVHPLALVSVAMWGATLIAALRSAARAPLVPGLRWWCRPVVFAMYVIQPVIRGWHRYAYRLGQKRLRFIPAPMKQIRQCTKRISLGRRDLYWTSNELCGREQLLEALVKRARLSGWRGDFHSEWSAYDVELIGDRWHDIRIQTATEELGWPKRFTRVRQQLRRTALTSVVLALNGIWTVAALATEQRSAMAAALLLWALTGVALVRSIHRCHQAAARLVWRAGRASRLEPVPITVAPQARPRQQAYIQPAEAPEEPEVALYAQG